MKRTGIELLIMALFAALFFWLGYSERQAAGSGNTSAVSVVGLYVLMAMFAITIGIILHAQSKRMDALEQKISTRK